MTDAPPDFVYYPGATADGRVHRSEQECAGCGRARGWISDAILYSADKPDEAYFCPWCIADGTAVRRFGGSFNELEPGVADDDAAGVVTERTPNFETWQDWFWPTHCGLPGVYRGQPSGEQLRARPDALAVLEFIDGLGGGVVAYLFECPSCGSPIVTWDAD